LPINLPAAVPRTIAFRRYLVTVLGIIWGTVGEWAAAIATLLAVVAAFAVQIREHRATAIRADRDEAARMAVWYESFLDGATGRPRWTMTVSNDGTSPIYIWQAAVWWLSSTGPSGAAHTESYEMQDARLGPLPPAGMFREEFGNAWSDDAGNRVFPLHPTSDLRVFVMWRDPRGRWWRRDGGDLTGPADQQWVAPYTVRSAQTPLA
jgi:hypothetical protein